MINNQLHISPSTKASIFFVGLVALGFILVIAKSILIPLVFAIIISVLLNPVVSFFVKIKFNRVISIIITILLSFILIAAFGLLLFMQLNKFGESSPILIEKLTTLLNDTTIWASTYFDIKPLRIQQIILESKTKLIEYGSSSIGQTLLVIGNWFVLIFLIPVYVFMILFYQPLILDFIRKLFSEDNQGEVTEVISQTKTVVQRYLVGLVIEALIVAGLNTLVLFLLGIEYAILLGLIGAILNLIPYIGGLVGVALPMVIALITKDSAWYALYVLVLYYIIQLIDNNLIVPKIVASKVKINALFSVIVVIVGNAIWGVSGMFLSIPILAIIKLISDHIEPLKPYGFLLGDTMPSIAIIKKFKTKKVVI